MRCRSTRHPPGSVEAVRREQLEGAAKGLREPREEPPESIHDARKRLKRTRSLLRLVRPAMTRKAFRSPQRALRDAGRALSGGA